MKFKIAVISLLTAIFAVCLFTSYTLIDKANKQFELQKLHIEIELEQYELNNGVIYYVGKKGTGEWISNAMRQSDRWRSEIDRICNAD